MRLLFLLLEISLKLSNVMAGFLQPLGASPYEWAVNGIDYAQALHGDVDGLAVAGGGAMPSR